MIRKGTFDDAAQMADIFNYYIANSTAIFSNRLRSADDMRGLLAPVVGNYPFFVSEDDGLLTGYCFAHAYMPDPVYSATWEITIYLRHGHTGRGTGSALLHSIIDEARRQGAHTLISCVTGGNEACSRMHLKAGFRLAGTLKQAGYKFGQFLDDELYQLILNKAAGVDV